MPQTTETKQLATEFDRRAAVAWIRAADAGLIDADELVYLLTGADPARLDTADSGRARRG
ncbi:MAG: hypothetical protein JWQ81_2595 [Amycolatopsis sp.]|jgi:hypothetical protein|uniref:hypothetical protein n=1 Tax=Amycolatopsis sp. TaxID=37632 RepID=UPI002609D614|nr:hypothetical protein [Amycolatopsis sp.]MCU1681856.1 hypothetical protein [Amycolatopsis sp.]